LVVDDDDVLTALAMALRQAGFRVSTARQRRHELAILRRGGIDLIVADSVLSGGTGEALAGQTKLPVILITVGRASQAAGDPDQRPSRPDRAPRGRTDTFPREALLDQ
jgi:DNA-binding response OmpR family regulator